MTIDDMRESIPPRPKESDDAVLLAAVEPVMDDVMHWLKLATDSAEREEVRDQVIAAVKAAGTIFGDGYKIASRLERDAHWDSDMGLAETLDGISVSSACQRAVSQWVDDYGVSPSHKIGDAVDYRGKDGFIAGPESAHRKGSYLVRIPSEGHAPENHGYVVAWDVIDGKVNATGPKPATIEGPLFGENHA